MNTPTLTSPTFNTPILNTPTFPSNSFNSYNYNSLCLDQSLTNIASQEPIIIEQKQQYDDYNGTRRTNSYSSISSSDHDALFEFEMDNKISQQQSDEFILETHGYRKIRKICDTKQGELILGFKISDISTGKIPEKIAIKKVSKTLHESKISVCDDISLITEENIIKEASILNYLTVENKFTDYVCQYIDFFSSKTHFYLITKYIEGETNLAQFIKKCHEYIEAKRLSIASYQKMTKFLFWQLAVIVHWMHDVHSICHLDLMIDNIMVVNGDFIQNKKDKSVIINPKVFIKICDFGLAEAFKQRLDGNKIKQFKCDKFELSDCVVYKAPQIFNEYIYDARKADIYSLGILYYQMIFGFAPYNFQNKNDIGYKAIIDNNMIELLKINNLLQYIRPSALDMINNCLNINENERFDALDVVQHFSMESYYNKYKKRMEREKSAQKKKYKQKKKKNRKTLVSNYKQYV
eukprot:59259_1